MSVKNSEQLQIRIDSKLKKEAKSIFDQLGLDMSSAVKMFFRQTVNAKNIPFELRDENGFTLQNAEKLREAIVDAESNKKSFKSADDLIKDALKD